MGTLARNDCGFDNRQAVTGIFDETAVTIAPPVHVTRDAGSKIRRGCQGIKWFTTFARLVDFIEGGGNGGVSFKCVVDPTRLHRQQKIRGM